MPWQKAFDVAETLEKAMNAFWARGYEATSMQDLVDCTGFNRGSLYATYGDKRTLFLAALGRYDEWLRREWLLIWKPVTGLARPFAGYLLFSWTKPRSPAETVAAF